MNVQDSLQGDSYGLLFRSALRCHESLQTNSPFLTSVDPSGVVSSSQQSRTLQSPAIRVRYDITAENAPLYPPVSSRTATVRQTQAGHYCTYGQQERLFASEIPFQQNSWKLFARCTVPSYSSPRLCPDRFILSLFSSNFCSFQLSGQRLGLCRSRLDHRLAHLLNCDSSTVSVNVRRL